MNLDWLKVLVAEAKFRCVKRDYPRKWELTIAYQLVYVDTAHSIIQRTTGFEVYEHTPTGRTMSMPTSNVTADDIRRTENVRRFRMARQAIYNLVMEAETSKVMDGQEFRCLLPAGMPYVRPGPEKSKKIQRAEKRFERDYEIIPPSPEDPLGWALKHQRSGVTLFFKSDVPIHRMTRDQIKAMAHRMIEEMQVTLEKAAKTNGGPRVPAS